MMRHLCLLMTAQTILFSQGLAKRSGNLGSTQYGRIEGAVVSDLTGSPLTRARIYLKSASGETEGLTVEADEKGEFVINNVVPGKYSLSAQRDGYLPSSVAQRGTSRLAAVIEIDSGEKLTDVRFRMRPWSIIAGRIRFNDAEPAMNVLVQVFQDAYLRGRRSFRAVATARTNDRGEYRIASIRAGSYYVAATYDRQPASDFRQQDPLDENGKPRPQLRYSTTFYPSAQKLSEAVPIRVGTSQEAAGLDIFLQPVPTVTVSGTVLSGLSGAAVKSPSVSLRRLSGDERSSINAAISSTPRGNGFELRGVAAGRYLLVADSHEENHRLFARVPIVVADANIEEVQLLLVPEKRWKGTLRFADAPNVKLSGLRVVLEPRSDLNPIVWGSVDSFGNFEVNVMPDEVYDAYVPNAPAEAFIKSIRVSNANVEKDGISGQMAGPNVPLEIVLSMTDAVLTGRVWSADGTPASGATVSVVPEPAHDHPQFYRMGFSDQNGFFQVHGLAPGRYTAFGYYDEPPCELYDEAELATCRSQGFNFTAESGGQTVVGVRLR